jgi:fructokinase
VRVFRRLACGGHFLLHLLQSETLGFRVYEQHGKELRHQKSRALYPQPVTVCYQEVPTTENSECRLRRGEKSVFGAIEAGGTKFVCAVGTDPANLAITQLPTTSPELTMADALNFLRERSDGKLHAIGIGSFGPVDLSPSSPTFGHITSTPKIAWQNFNFVGTVRAAFDVPIGFDTDVNAAALGEAPWGAAQSISDFVYLTVGTGIGGGVIVNGQLLHGLIHPEMGHIRIPHDRQGDHYPGCCPFHGDCLEGLASGPAIQERWGKPAPELPIDHPAWTLEAHYLALGLANWFARCRPSASCLVAELCKGIGSFL